MTATTGLGPEGWRLVFAVLCTGCLVALVVAACTDLRPRRPRPRLRYEEPLTRVLNDWADDITVAVPNLDPVHVPYNDPDAVDAPTWAWTPDTTVTWQGHAIEGGQQPRPRVEPATRSRRPYYDPARELHRRLYRPAPNWRVA